MQQEVKVCGSEKSCGKEISELIQTAILVAENSIENTNQLSDEVVVKKDPNSCVREQMFPILKCFMLS